MFVTDPNFDKSKPRVWYSVGKSTPPADNPIYVLGEFRSDWVWAELRNGVTIKASYSVDLHGSNPIWYDYSGRNSAKGPKGFDVVFWSPMDVVE